MAQEDKRLRRRIRNSYFISTVSIAMVLFLLGATTYLILNVLNATNRLRESVVIYVMLRDGLSAEQTAAVRQSLESQDIVREVKYVSKEQAAADFIAETGEDFRSFLGDDPAANPLPDSFEVGLSANALSVNILGIGNSVTEGVLRADTEAGQTGGTTPGTGGSTGGGPRGGTGGGGTGGDTGGSTGGGPKEFPAGDPPTSPTGTPVTGSPTSPTGTPATGSATASSPDPIASFVAAAEALPGVQEVVYQRGVMEQIGTNLGKFNLVLLLFGGSLLVISLILLNNTIRMTIIAKRRIISTMQLVGATGGFIMRPFAGSALLHGLYAGVIATAVFALLVFGLQEGVPEINLMKDNMLLGAIAGGMIVLGVVISLLFTVLALRKALRQESIKALI